MVSGLTLIAKNFYAKHLGYIMTDTLNLLVVDLFYLIYILAMVVLVIFSALEESSLLPTALLIFVYLAFLYLLSLNKRKNYIYDIAWDMGFILVSVYNLYTSWNPKIILMTLLVTIWELRLAFHIFSRNKNKKKVIFLLSLKTLSLTPPGGVCIIVL